MFRKIRRLKLPYARQGLLYFFCRNREWLPKWQADAIRALSKHIAGEYDEALWAALTRDRTLAQTGREHYVSDQTLSRLRAQFYLALDSWMRAGIFFETELERGMEAMETHQTETPVLDNQPKRGGRHRPKRDPLSEGLRDAAALAVRWMARILDDPETGDDLKYKCAMAILERVCAKAAPLKEEKDTDTTLSVILSKEVDKFAH